MAAFLDDLWYVCEPRPVTIEMGDRLLEESRELKRLSRQIVANAHAQIESSRALRERIRLASEKYRKNAPDS